MPAAAHNRFRFHVPLETMEKGDAPPGQELRIGGWISTEHRDQDDEVVLQDGLDFSYLMTKGWFNDNHSQKAVDVLGYPTKIERGTYKGKAATRIEGYLIPDKRGRELYGKIQWLAKNDSPRKFGFSVEGTIDERGGTGGKLVKHARVRHVAVTHCPINAHTELEALAKALTAGSSVGAPGTATAGDGFALRTESLEGVPHSLTEPRPKKKKKKRASLTKAEAIAVIQRRLGFRHDAALRVYALVAGE